jgi:hypothetical protein
MRYYGTITGLQATTPTTNIPVVVGERPVERPEPNYLRLALIVIVVAGIAYLIGRRR